MKESTRITRKHLILDYLAQELPKNPNGIGCTELTKFIIERDMLKGNIAHHLSGSISSILAKLVKEGILKYSKHKSPKGGHLYLIS